MGDDCGISNSTTAIQPEAGDRLASADVSMMLTSGALTPGLLTTSSLPPALPLTSTSPDLLAAPVVDCRPEEQHCMVTRVEYSKAEVASPQRFFWALERRCAALCLDGCVAIGDGESATLSLSLLFSRD